VQVIFRSIVLAAAIASLFPLSRTEAAEQQHANPAHRTFDDPAAYAKSWESPERDAWQRPAELIAALGVRSGMNVADIGTGTGYLLPHLSRAAGPGGKVFAIDISQAMLKWVRDRAAAAGLDNVTAVQANSGATTLPAQSIDRAIMINVWHHIENKDAYARDLHSAIREGGVLFIVEARPEAGQDGPPRHFRLEPEVVISHLARAGFNATLDPFKIDRQYVIRAQR